MFSVGTSLWGTASSVAPDGLSGLIGWYDASDAATITYGVAPAATGWADKSPSANHLTGNGTVDTSGTLMSRYCMNQAGNVAWFCSAPFTQSGAMTAFVACYWPAGAGLNSQVYVSSGSDISGATKSLYAYAGGGNNLAYIVGGPLGADSARSNNLTVLGSAGKYQLSYILGATIGTDALHVNGVDQTMVYGGTSGNTNSTNFQGININQAGYPWHGRLGELILYNRQLNSTEVSQIEAYLKAKWGTP